MRRIIKYNAISDAASQILLQINILKDEQAQLLSDLDTLSTCYSGKDAEMVITEYKNRANTITGYIEFLEEYQNYFERLSSSYRTSHEKVKRDIEAEMIEPLENINNKNEIPAYYTDIMVEEGNSVWMI